MGDSVARSWKTKVWHCGKALGVARVSSDGQPVWTHRYNSFTAQPASRQNWHLKQSWMGEFFQPTVSSILRIIESNSPLIDQCSTLHYDIVYKLRWAWRTLDDSFAIRLNFIAFSILHPLKISQHLPCNLLTLPLQPTIRVEFVT